MPNGAAEHDKQYNYEWCREKHQKLDLRMDSLERKFWSIIILLFTNLGGIAVIIARGGL